MTRMLQECDWFQPSCQDGSRPGGNGNAERCDWWINLLKTAQRAVIMQAFGKSAAMEDTVASDCLS